MNETDQDKYGNKIAEPGMVYVCFACGKRSKDKYGDKSIDYGWDISCIMNSGLVKESQLVIENGRVKKIKGKIE